MTRTEITRRELEETKRHNQEQENIGKLNVVVDAGKMLYGKGGMAGLFMHHHDGSNSSNSDGGRDQASPNKTRSFNRKLQARKEK